LVRFGQFLQRCDIEGERAFAPRNDLRLLLQESGRGFLASRLGLSDGTLVSVENGQCGRKSECEKVILLLVGVTRSDLDVWILLGNLKLQVGFGCGVLC